MSQWRKRLTLSLAALLLCPTLALAKPEIVVTMEAKKEITIVHEDGTKEVKIVPAETISPGEVIIFSLAYTNGGSQAAHGVVVDNPIPDGTAYVLNSATQGGGELVFSIDGGKSFKMPTLLTYEVSKPDGSAEKRVASPEEYTHIRWRIEEVPAGTGGELTYRVKVK